MENREKAGQHYSPAAGDTVTKGFLGHLLSVKWVAWECLYQMTTK